jgi:NADH-quinone oxidoreductase subunit M
MILQGTFASPHAGWRYAAFAVSGIVLGAAYLLWLYQRLMFGKLDKPENEKLRDVTWREQATLLPIVALCVWIGVYPKPFLDPLRVPVRAIVERIEPAARFAEEPMVPPAAETGQQNAGDDN